MVRQKKGILSIFTEKSQVHSNLKYLEKIAFFNIETVNS